MKRHRGIGIFLSSMRCTPPIRLLWIKHLNWQRQRQRLWNAVWPMEEDIRDGAAHGLSISMDALGTAQRRTRIFRSFGVSPLFPI